MRPPFSQQKGNDAYGKTSEQTAQTQAEEAQGPCGTLAELRVLRTEGEKGKKGETPSDRIGDRAGRARNDDVHFPVRRADAMMSV